MADSDVAPGQDASGRNPAVAPVTGSAEESPRRGSGTSPGARWWTVESTRWILVTLLIPFSGFVWNEVQKREANRQLEIERVRAQEQERLANARSESDIVIRLMPALAAEDSSPTRGIAFAILMNLADREALSPELASAVQVAVDNAQQRIRDGTATQAEVDALTRIAAATDELLPQRVEGSASQGSAPQGSGGTAARPTAARTLQLEVPRIYIHIFDEAHRPAAEALTRWITTDRRWLAPGIENVAATAQRTGGRVPVGVRRAEIRFFNDADRGYAQEISDWLTRSGTPSVARKIDNLKAPSGQIEVWFPGA